MVTITCAATIVAISARTKQKSDSMRSMQPCIHRCSILLSLRCTSSTHWEQLLSCGTSSNFIRKINIGRHCLWTMLMLRFKAVRNNVQFGSPYRRGPKTRGFKPLLEFIDFLGLVLRYLKSIARQNEPYGMFGVVPSTLSAWIDFGLAALFQIL